jgi:hypothetical protein
MMRGAVALAALAFLTACGEKPQTNAEGVKHDAAPWSGTSTNGEKQAGGTTVFTAAGYKPGDKAAWEQQLKARAQGQNEYVRQP